jgi:mannan endo-1,4-beta-mannosidase
MLIGLISIFVMQQKTSSQSETTQFVTTRGEHFYLQNKQLRSVGVNRYNLLTYIRPGGQQIGCANPFSEQELDTVFANFQSMGVTTVRFWVFQSFTKSGQDMRRLDYVVAAAEKHNIKLIPVFENHWQDCTEEGEKTEQWYASGYQSAYGSYPLSLKQYISAIVPRYKDNPTILAWEIINEPRVDEHVLYDFTKDISEHIKAIDENHLVSIGMVGSHHESATYETIYRLGSIDYIDYHDYDYEEAAMPEKLEAMMALSRQLNKPIVVGESGIRSNFENREQLFANKMNAFFDNGGAIYLLWSYGDSYITNDGFNVSPTDPSAKRILETAETIP